MQHDKHLGDVFGNKALTETIEARRKARSELLEKIDSFISEEPSPHS